VDGKQQGGQATVVSSNDKEAAGPKAAAGAGTTPVDFKAGLKKVSAPLPEAAKPNQSGGLYASAQASQQQQQQQPDFKSQLKKTSKSSGLYGGGSAAAPAAVAQEEEEGGFLGFKSQLRKVPKPSEAEAGSPSQSDQFR
jgi:hypothetical protein